MCGGEREELKERNPIRCWVPVCPRISLSTPVRLSLNVVAESVILGPEPVMCPVEVTDFAVFTSD